MPAKPTNLRETDSVMLAVTQSNPLYKFRQAQNPVWSLRHAALYIGVTQTPIQKWESGTNYPTDDNLRAIARVMNKTFEQLSLEWQAWSKRKQVLVNASARLSV